MAVINSNDPLGTKQVIVRVGSNQAGKAISDNARSPVVPFLRTGTRIDTVSGGDLQVKTNALGEFVASSSTGLTVTGEGFGGKGNQLVESNLIVGENTIRTPNGTSPNWETLLIPPFEIPAEGLVDAQAAQETGISIGLSTTDPGGGTGTLEPTAAGAPLMTASAMQVSVSSIDFGDVLPGGQSTRSFTISNTGTSELTYDFDLDFPAGSLDLPTNITIHVPVGGFSVYDVTLTDTDPSNPLPGTSGLLTINSNDPVAPNRTIPLTVNQQSGFIRLIDENGDGINDLAMDTIRSGTSAQRGLSIRNDGNAAATVQVTNEVTVPPPAGTTLTLPTLDTILGPGSTSSLLTTNVDAGAVDGSFEFRIMVNTNASNGPSLTISGSGRVANEHVSVDPTLIDFGNVQVGHSVQRTVTITNVGEIPIIGVDLAISPAPPLNVITLSPAPGPWSIDPGDSLLVLITFAPAAAQAYGPFSLTIDHSAYQLPDPTVSLQGTGVAAGASFNENFDDFFLEPTPGAITDTIDYDGTTWVLDLTPFAPEHTIPFEPVDWAV